MVLRLQPSSRQTRLERLISSGYFPAELPPPFTTRNFARYVATFSREWSGRAIRRFLTRPEVFSIPRAGRVRRQLAIVNPINQLHVSDLIASHWRDIQERLRRSAISEFRPLIQLGAERRAISGINFNEVDRRKIQILARYGRYIKTDIVRFFPSVRTDTIVWGLLGREWLQQHQGSEELAASYASQLVEAVRAGQGGDNVGIPVGPDTSRILSEIVATEIEQAVRLQVPDLDDRSVRYVDDMIVGVGDQESSVAMAANIGAALYEFDLQLNDEKTAVHGIGHPASSDWIYFLQRFEVSQSTQRQREDVDSFFEQATRLADEHPRIDVLLFAAKLAVNFNISAENRDHFCRWLLYVARRSQSCLPFIAEHLAFQHRTGEQGPVDEIRRFIREQIPSRARAAHTCEVAWLLFWARETQTKIDSSALRDVLRLRSSICALIVFDLRDRNLIDGVIDLAFWRSFANEDGLASEMWMVAYEASQRQWWPGRTSRTFLRNHPFFNNLFERNVSFYAQSAVARRAGIGRLFASVSIPSDIPYLQR